MTQHLDLDALQAAAEERNSVGAQLANVAFNWKQKCGHKITQADCDMLALLQLQWDASINVVPTIIDRLRKAEAAREGWKFVPIDPTPAMLNAGRPCMNELGVQYAEATYRAMVAAAPTAADSEGAKG